MKNDPILDAEIEEECFARALAKLKRGSRERGSKLTPGECWILLEKLKPAPKRKQGHPRMDESEKLRRIYMGLNCFEYENQGMSITEAMAKTAEDYKMSVSTVRDARRRIIKRDN